MSSVVIEYVSAGSSRKVDFSLDGALSEVESKLKKFEGYFKENENVPLTQELFNVFPVIKVLLNDVTTQSQLTEQERERVRERVKDCWKRCRGYEMVDRLLRAGV